MGGMRSMSGGGEEEHEWGRGGLISGQYEGEK